MVYCIRPIGWRGHAKHVRPRRKSRHLARGKRSATPGIHHPPPSCVRRGRELHIIPGITAQYGRMALNANYLNLQPLCGWFYLCDCRYPHVADCASLIVNMGLLRLQPLCGCAMGGIAYARTHRKGIVNMVWCLSSSIFLAYAIRPYICAWLH